GPRGSIPVIGLSYKILVMTLDLFIEFPDLVGRQSQEVSMLLLLLDEFKCLVSLDVDIGFQLSDELLAEAQLLQLFFGLVLSDVDARGNRHAAMADRMILPVLAFVMGHVSV